MDDRAPKSGYSYEYLQKLASYTGWKYEYVYGEWDELFEKLKDGEIDLMAEVWLILRTEWIRSAIRTVKC